MEVLGVRIGDAVAQGRPKSFHVSWNHHPRDYAACGPLLSLEACARWVSQPWESSGALFVGSFPILVGVEEAFSVAVISEGFARGAPIIVGLLLLLWITCCVVFTFYFVLARRLR